MKKMMDSTTVIITTTDNRVLLQKRDENPDIEYSGYYSLVSGYLEEEETPLDGIIRELKEEFEHKKSQKWGLSIEQTMIDGNIFIILI